MVSDWWQTYADVCRQSLTIKRYTSTAANRTSDDYAVRGNARQYSAPELIGAIRQGDWHVVVLAEDLVSLDFPLPVLGSDRVVVDDREMAIIMPKSRKDFDGNLVAYELQCRG